MAGNIKNGDFGNGSVKRLILSQAVPLTLAQIVQLLYNIVDRVYIGHMPGADASMALTGVGLCFPIITLLASFINWISTGASPLCSMARGKQDLHRAQKILTTAYTALLGISALIALVTYVIRRPLLFLLGASEVTYTYAADYLSVYLMGTLFFAVSMGLNTFINLQGFPKKGMLTTVIGAVINLILDPIFIFGLHLGVRGAALATVLSQFCAAAWVMITLSKKGQELRLKWNGFELDTTLLKEILTLGLAGFVMGATNCAVQAVCNATLSVFGGDIYISIMTIINSVREMIGLPVNGITSGSQPILSFNYGAKKIERVKEGIRFSAFMGISYTAVFWVSTMLIPQVYLNIFTNDSRVLELGRTPLIVYFMGFIFMSLQFVGQSSFVAFGKAKQAVFFSIFRKIIIVVPLTLILPHIAGLGVMGIFLAEPISNLIGGSASFLCMYFTVYRKLENS